MLDEVDLILVVLLLKKNIISISTNYDLLLLDYLAQPIYVACNHVMSL